MLSATAIRPSHYSSSDELPVRCLASMRPASPPIAEQVLERPALVSNSYGEMDAVLMTLPATVFHYAAYGVPLSDLIGKLPGNTRLLFSIPTGFRQRLEEWLCAADAFERSTIIENDADLALNLWSGDDYAAVRDVSTGISSTNPRVLVGRRLPGGLEDQQIRCSELPVADEISGGIGGNLLVGDDFAIVGRDAVARLCGEDLDAFTRIFQQLFDSGRELFVLGTELPVPSEGVRPFQIDGYSWQEQIYLGNCQGSRQPMPNLDSFVTLAGRDGKGSQTVLVGCPRAAAGMLGLPLPDHALWQHFDDIAARIAGWGMTVVRNPLPLVYRDFPDQRLRRWYFASANSALVQTTHTHREVWLPTYGHGSWAELRHTDRANAAVWSELGYAVTRLGDFHPFAEKLGTVQCISKNLGRV